MTPGRLFLFAIICLVLAGVLLFAGPPNMLMSVLAGLFTLSALTAYFTAIYLRRTGDKGERALANLRVRIAQATTQEILDEYRVFHIEGFSGVAPGEFVIFYETESNWVLVPLLEELAWVEVPKEKLGTAELAEGPPGQGYTLKLEFETLAEQKMSISVCSSRLDPSEQTAENVVELLDLRDLMSAKAQSSTTN